jgi:hypothetical protein
VAASPIEDHLDHEVLGRTVNGALGGAALALAMREVGSTHLALP